jgi:hypothetical protein
MDIHVGGAHQAIQENNGACKICREDGNNFNKNLQKVRMERLMTNVWGHATTVYGVGGGHPQSAVYVNKIFRSEPMGNLEHTVGDIHNILKAYYEVARERFVDTICIQGLDYHLLSGSDTPVTGTLSGLCRRAQTRAA